jgi:hypothetical protein
MTISGVGSTSWGSSFPAKGKKLQLTTTRLNSNRKNDFINLRDIFAPILFSKTEECADSISNLSEFKRFV